MYMKMELWKRQLRPCEVQLCSDWQHPTKRSGQRQEKPYGNRRGVAGYKLKTESQKKVTSSQHFGLRLLAPGTVGKPISPVSGVLLRQPQANQSSGTEGLHQYGQLKLTPTRGLLGNWMKYTSELHYY